MQSFLEIIKKNIHQYALFSPDAKLVVAVSGGADSIALLHALVELRDTTSYEALTLHVATLNHGLRADAAADVAYVQQFAANLNVAVTAGYADVANLSRINNESLETAGRRARYNFLADVAREIGASTVVTAHHADDQTETILMHILRGSGLNGLTGMSYQSAVPDHDDLRLVRPLLSISRAQIESYCAENNLQPRLDASNFDTVFVRNAVRHQILPHLRAINPQFDEALHRLADNAGVVDAFLQAEFDQQCLPYIKFAQRSKVEKQRFLSWHEALQRRAIRALAAHHNLELDYSHIVELIEFAQRSANETGGRITLPDKFQFRSGYRFFYMEHSDDPLPVDYLSINAEVFLKPAGEITDLGEWGIYVSETELPSAQALAVPAGARLTVRPRRAGDRWQPLGLNGHSQKIKKWMIDHKIPQHIRDSIPLLCINDTIAAVILKGDWKISDLYAMRDNNQRILYFKLMNV